MRNFLIIMSLVLAGLCVWGCSRQAAASAPKGGARASAMGEGAASNEQAPAYFCADSAYGFVAKQVEFGPRVPGSTAAERCGDWLVERLNAYGAQNVTEQRTQVSAYNGDKLNIRNISAQYLPEATQRILLLAHWDSRPWADQEPKKADRDRPIDGANDGASGVGVILELARQMQARAPRVGVDILFVDAEDYGRRADEKDDDPYEETWCLGSKYWTENPTIPLETINYAILLDMVGGKDAVFPREQISYEYAPQVVDVVWKAAARAGYSDRFPTRKGGAVMDDHVYLLRNRVPAIDIIESDNHKTGTFPPYWHTHADNMDNIDPATLRAVGETISSVIF